MVLEPDDMFCILNQVSPLKDPKRSKTILRAVMTGHVADFRSLGVYHIIKVDLCLQWHSYHVVMDQYTLYYLPIVLRTQIPVQSLELAILQGNKSSRLEG